MPQKCNRCASYAINPGEFGRDETSDLDLCDLCYWRKRAESPGGIAFNVETALTQARLARNKIEGHEITSVLLMRLQVASHLQSVIEQLEEIDRKVKGK